MKTTLRLLLLLFAWVALGKTEAWAAPVAAPKTATTGNLNQLYSIPGFSATLDAGQTVSSYRFESIPANTAGVVGYPVNADGTGGYTAAAAGQTITAAQAANLVFQPSGTFTGTTTFNYTVLQSNNARSANALYTINVRIAANDQTAAIMPNTNGQTLLPALTASTTPTNFKIVSLPATAAGILYVNGAAATAGQVISTTQATQLTFDPAAGYAGNAYFQYAAIDGTGTDGPAGRYSLPISKAACGQTSALDFSRRGTPDDWKAHANVLVSGTNVSSSSYSTSVTGTNTNTFAVGNTATLPGPALVWQQNNIGNNPAVTPNVAKVTFTFDRAVSNLSMALTDLDKDLVNANFIDEVTFDGFATDASTTPITLTASDVALGNTNQFVTGTNTVQGTSTGDSDPASTVVITFPSAVKKITLTYRNTAPYVNATTDRTQTVGIPSFIWCAQTEVFTRFTSGTQSTTTGSNVNYTVEFGNNGPDAAATLTRTITLPAGVSNVAVPTGATYDAASRVIDFGTATAVASGTITPFTFSFNAPATAGTYSLLANVGTPAEDPNLANNAATLPLVVSDCNVTSTLNYATVTPTGIRSGTVNGGAASEGPVTDAASDGITVKYQNFTSSANTTQDDFFVGTSGATVGQSLVWQVNSSATGTQTSITLLLSRPVDNLTFNIQDIDKNINPQNFIDRVKFDGFPTAASNTAAILTAGNFTLGTANSFIGNNTVEGISNSNAGEAFGNLTVRFTSPVQRIVLTYTNQSASTATSRQQTLGINSLMYCSPADVATTIAAATNPVNGGSQGQFNVTFTNNGPNTAATITRQVQLIPGLANVVASNGGTYDSGTGLVTYGGAASLASGANLNSTITFTAPISGNVTASSTINTTSSEGGLTTNNNANANLSITPVADVATAITGPASVNAGQTATLNVTYSNIGALDASTVTRTASLPAGVLNVVASGGTVTGTVTTGYTITYPTLATLAAGASNSFTITYTAPASGSVTATSTTSTTTTEGGLTANNTSSVTTPVGLVADVTTTVDGPTAIFAGQPSGNYTAAFSNNGPSTASAVTQRVTLPVGATNVLVNGTSYTPVNNVIDFGTAASLNSGATNLFTFSFTAPTTTGSVSTVSNVGTITNQGSNTAADAATLTVTINPDANVAATITAVAANATAGQVGSFNVTFTNSGPSLADGVVAQVQLPAGLLNVVASNGGSYNSTTGVVSYPGLTSLVTMGSSASTITFTAPASGSVAATASTSTTTNELGRTANNAASASISVTPSYDVTTSISGPATTAVGVQTTFSVGTVNNGPSGAPRVVQTVTGLPTNLTNVYVSNGGVYDASTGTVTFPSLATLATGIPIDNTISFTPTVTSTGFTATATVTANTNNTGDSNTGNNSVAAASMTVNSAPAASTATNLFTTITTPSTTVTPGATATFTVTSGNAGPGTATSVAQLVTLPPGLAGVVVKASDGTVFGRAYDAATGVVTLPTVASLASGASLQYTIDITTPTSNVVAAVATISAATADVMPSNNIATADITVAPLTDVVVRLTGPNTVGSGTAATYTVTTTNNGPVTASNVVTTVSIPVGLSGVSVSGGGSYNASTGAVTFPASTTLGNGGSTANTITYTVPSIGTFSSVASVTSSTPDKLLANNTATVATLVEPLADIVVSLNGPATIVQGNQVDYVLSAINNGSATATNTVLRVQLPAGLGSVVSTGGTYNNTTGILTFPALATQIPGTDGAISYGIRFIAPSTLTNLYATASVSTSSEETSYANNTASLSTTATPATTGQTDLQIAVSPSAASPVAGQSLTLTVTTTNVTGANTTVAATNVVQRVAIEPGLTIASISNGGTYDPITGIVTFPTVASIAIGGTVTNTIVLTTPGATPFTTRGLVTGDQTDAVPGNNVSFNNLTVAQRADVATAISGPATAQPGDPVTYSVVTQNNGPSAAANVVQTVTLPAGATNVVLSGNGTLSGNTVTFPTISSQVAGGAGQVVNTISFNAPAAFTASYAVTANVTTTTTQPASPGTTNDAATQTTLQGNRAPVANAVVNTVQTPEGNTAAALPLSPLSGFDADGNSTIASYTITSIPNAATQGVLRLSGTAVTVSQVIAVADIANLTFDPVTTFVGNAFFTYTVADNAGAVSEPATYTIPVGQDIDATYSQVAYAAGKVYQNADIVANVLDANAARYDGNGRIYSPATGALLATDGSVSNGLATTGVNAVPTSAADAATLANNGLALNAATGQITVIDRTKLKSGTFTFTITTTDLNGGTNNNLVSITLSAPLPVELVTFEAKAVKLNAQLTWRTASEKNNDHFIVERSFTGNAFVKIGTLAGQGTSSQAHVYSFVDAGIGAAYTGTVYYRLQQLDTDGTTSASPIRAVSFAKSGAHVELYPNPAESRATLDLTTMPAGNYSVSLIDMSGRILTTMHYAGAAAYQLDVQSLPQGVYTVSITGADGTLYKRLTKK